MLYNTPFTNPFLKMLTSNKMRRPIQNIAVARIDAIRYIAIDFFSNCSRNAGGSKEVAVVLTTAEEVVDTILFPPFT